jgi:hypothetical protein
MGFLWFLNSSAIFRGGRGHMRGYLIFLSYFFRVDSWHVCLSLGLRCHRIQLEAT